MRLNKKQKEAVLQWVAEGLESDEINRRAAKFKPPFKVSKTQVAFYRKSRQVNLQEIKQSAEFDALKSGLALKVERVKVLQQMANKFITDLMPEDDGENKRWLLQVKGIGSQDNYERVEYYEFNKAEVDALRGVLDDIASEVGERLKIPENSNLIQPVVHIYMPKNDRNK